MFSSGWIWFVTDKAGNLAVFPTFGPGTLLVRSSATLLPNHWQGTLGSDDFGPRGSALQSRSASLQSAPAPSSPTSGASHSVPPMDLPTPSRVFSTSSLLLNGNTVGTQNSIYSSRTTGTTTTNNNNSNNGGGGGGSPFNSTQKQDPRRVGEYLYPLFCLSVHERMWVGAGYGVWGKEEYVKRFFSVLDWEKVAQAYVKWVPDPRRSEDRDMRRATYEDGHGASKQV